LYETADLSWFITKGINVILFQDKAVAFKIFELGLKVQNYYLL